MLLLGLDISTKTGYALIESSSSVGEDLLELGLLTVPDQDGPYPYTYIRRSHQMAEKILAIVDAKQPKLAVIEETNPARNAYGQKLLEWIHFLVVEGLSHRNIPIVYLRTGIWRQKLEAKLTPEDRKTNQKLNRLKEKAGGDAETLRALKKENGIRGKVSRKAPALRIVNELYPTLGLKAKDNDKADALCLCLAYKKGAEHCDPKIENKKRQEKKRKEKEENATHGIDAKTTAKINGTV